ncbi:hypothetical protein Droror1_Dr00014097 [Drosera rotundifolia]
MESAETAATVAMVPLESSVGDVDVVPGRIEAGVGVSVSCYETEEAWLLLCLLVQFLGSIQVLRFRLFDLMLVTAFVPSQ